MSATRISDYGLRALRRLIEQLKNKQTIGPVLLAVGVQVQAVEDALWQLLTERDIDSAVGAQLDVLGKIVNEARGGTSDTDYRLRVRARILANRSTGTHEDIYRVFRALLAGVVGYTLQCTPAYPAGFMLRVNGVAIAPALLYIFVRFLGDSKGAGIAAWLGWQEVPDADAFTCSVPCFLSTASMMAATSLTVYSTADFPASGAFVIDEGLATEEALTYTGKTSTTLTGVSAAAFAHDVNACCALVPSPGRGHGDELNAATGGALVGIVPA